MSNEADIKARFWKELKSERTIMVGVDGEPGGEMQPMTALVEEDDGGPLWIFTSKETDLARSVGAGKAAHATFTGKKHDLFASITGRLSLDRNRVVIDRLWNPWVAAWFEGGKDDPKLALIRLDPENAEIWIDASSVVAGIKMLLGIDPKEDYKDKVAEVAL